MQRLKTFLVLGLISVFIITSVALTEGDEANAINSKDNSCLSCHKGIENIRNPASEMMQEILKVASKSGFAGNDCIVCHGGNPTAKTEQKAHQGTIAYFKNHEGPQTFYPDPGSPWINKNTCGTCHKEQVSTQFTNLMFTEAGKIQGTLWSFGAMNGYKHDIGNYDVEATDVHNTLGTDVYKKYMAELKDIEPNVFPSKMTTLPEAPTAEEVEKNPKLAVYTYLRQECQRCHTGNKGRQKRGDFRGLGCSSCHIPYSNNGFYEGGDLAIDRKEPGHVLVHSLQSTRDCKVVVHEKAYSGIPVETCTTCHNRGKRIGTSFQGLMETAYSSPFMGGGGGQEKLHTKKYIHLHADIHKDKGMLCQDCHTSGDVHGDGNLAGTTLAPVEIECQDCHGTPQQYPWELPIGYSDETDGNVPRKGAPRGVLTEVLDYLNQGTKYDAEDGFLISSRGNPLTNVVRKGNSIILHTAGGKDIEYDPLKKTFEDGKMSHEAIIAMVNVQSHIDKMECYTCHSTWAPQCYGCHIEIDYSTGEKRPDWVSMGHDHDESGLTAGARKEYDQHLIDGKVSETRSYLRWENPPLVVNGENRITPAIPGCQTTISVIGKSGKHLLTNHIFKIPNVEGAGEEGQNAIDVSPVQPHTTTKKSRTCESCHNNAMAMGYGIEGGAIYEDPSKPYVVDLTDAEGNVLPHLLDTQIHAIPNLKHDWSTIIDSSGKQVQTVGHHYKSSRPLNQSELSKLDRRGVCESCHNLIPDGDLAVDMMTHIKEVSHLHIDNEEHQSILQKSILFTAWGQILLGVLILVLIGIIIKKKWFY